jgi:hypothetical protein
VSSLKRRNFCGYSLTILVAPQTGQAYNLIGTNISSKSPYSWIEDRILIKLLILISSKSYFAVPILGSRDWNRSPHYRLEIGMIN